MTGLINWNELRKAMMSEHHMRMKCEDPAHMWDKRADDFNKSTRQNQERTLKQIERFQLKPEYSVLDVGAGTGRLSIPIAKQVAKVTAIDQSTGMLNYLKENMENEGLTNIDCIQKRWEDVKLGEDIEPHDVVVASHSLGMFDLQEAIEKIDAAAKKYVYVLTFAGKWMFDGKEEELWERLHDRPMRHRGWHSDYMLLYNILHDMGIYANVEVKDVKHEQHYDNLDDAVSRWKEMRDIPPEKEHILRDHLSNILEQDGNGGYFFKHKSKSAMIWWSKAE